MTVKDSLLHFQTSRFFPQFFTQDFDSKLIVFKDYSDSFKIVILNRRIVVARKS